MFGAIGGLRGPHGGFGGPHFGGPMMMVGPRFGPRPMMMGPYYGGYRYRRYGSGCCNIF